jgi:hypothetical protein
MWREDVMPDVKIDPELQKLLPSLSADELTNLETSVLSEGIRDPLIVWQGSGILLDGHNRFMLAEQHGLPYRVQEMAFDTRDEARRWMILNQLSRRNLRPDAASYLRGCLVRMTPREKGARTDATSSNNLTRLQAVADEAGVTRQTLHNDAAFAEAVDALADAVGEEARELATSGRIPRKDTKLLAQTLATDPDAVKASVEKVLSGEQPDVKQTMRAARRTRRKEQAEAIIADAAPGDLYDTRHGDFRTVLTDIPDDSVALVFTDPPWDDETARTLYEDLFALAARILVPGGSLITYVGHNALPQVLATPNPLRYWWPLAAVFEGGPTPRLPGKFVLPEWRPLLWFVKGGRRSTEYLADCFRCSPEPDAKEHHDWQQPETPASLCIERLTDAGETVVDPFLGGGTTGAAAVKLGRLFVGCDIDADALTIATGRIAGYAKAARTTQ